MELKSNIIYAEFVKSGGKLEKVVGQVAGINFSKKDFVVLIAGSNDVYENEEKSVFRNLKTTIRYFISGQPKLLLLEYPSDKTCPYSTESTRVL